MVSSRRLRREPKLEEAHRFFPCAAQAPSSRRKLEGRPEMAQPPRPAANGDDFVRHIVTDPKNVPDVMLLYGYPGASSEEGHERLYLSPDLSAYVEVPNGSILHRAEASKERDPHGGVTLWVKKDAALKYRMAPAQEAAQKAMAWYFAGALQGGAAGQAGPQPLLPQTLPNALCPPVTLPDACPVTANI